MEYKLKDGQTVTDEQLEQMASEFEAGDWEGHLEDVVVSVPEREEPTKVVTFRTTPSRDAAVKAAAKAAGMTPSEFYRRAVDRQLAAMAE